MDENISENSYDFIKSLSNNWTDYNDKLGMIKSYSDKERIKTLIFKDGGTLDRKVGFYKDAITIRESKTYGDFINLQNAEYEIKFKEPISRVNYMVNIQPKENKMKVWQYRLFWPFIFLGLVRKN